ncbi:MAG: hypothetical protein R2828_27440 [Saprospiraceae bacterium]
MDSNQKPSLKEYLRANPGKGLNDYFSKYGGSEDTTASTQPILTGPLNKNDTSSRSIRIEWFGIIISLGMMGAFFLPWISSDLFVVVTEDPGTEIVLTEALVTGMQIPEYFANWETSFVSIPDHFLAHYLILIGAGLALVGALFNWYWLKFFGAAISTMLVVRWLIVLRVMAHSEQFATQGIDIWPFIQMGTYTAATCAVLYVVDFIREWF